MVLGNVGGRHHQCQMTMGTRHRTKSNAYSKKRDKSPNIWDILGPKENA
jgi:hypothetical protein